MSAIECAFLGVLGRDAEQKISKSGNSYLRLSVRVGDGDAATWVSVLSFDSAAVEISDRFVKNAKVYVEGKLSLNEWTNTDGVVKTSLSVMSFHTRLAQIGRQNVKREGDRASIAEGKTYRSPRSAPAGRLQGGGDFDDPIPFAPEVRG